MVHNLPSRVTYHARINILFNIQILCMMHQFQICDMVLKEIFWSSSLPSLNKRMVPIKAILLTHFCVALMGSLWQGDVQTAGGWHSLNPYLPFQGA